MTIKLSNYRDSVCSLIEGRELLWFGVRGSDATAIDGNVDLKHCFSVLAPLNKSRVSELCLESELKHRIEHNYSDIDNDNSREASYFRINTKKIILEKLQKKSLTIVPYRPSRFLTSIYFPIQHQFQYLGNFFEFQQCFEHKPWVETCLSKEGIRTIGWEYLSDGYFHRCESMFDRDKRKFVLRANRGAGGTGLVLINSKEDLVKAELKHGDGFLGIAPYLEPNIPININACVTCDGKVIVHPASFQLIGINSCINLKFGYCGNDFAAIKNLKTRIINRIENITKRAGKWLYNMGFLGAFGLDLIYYNDYLLVTEINPRFQCSTPIAALISKELGLPDLYMDHMAAFLGVQCSLKRPPLVEITRQQTPIAQVICNNKKPFIVYRCCKEEYHCPKGFEIECLPELNVDVEEGAMLFKLICSDAVTEDGKSLFKDVRVLIDSITNHYFSINTPILPGI